MTVNPIELQKHLGGVDYPASRDDLVAAAEKNGAGDDVLDALKGLPERDFDAPTDVTQAVSGE